MTQTLKWKLYLATQKCSKTCSVRPILNLDPATIQAAMGQMNSMGGMGGGLGGGMGGMGMGGMGGLGGMGGMGGMGNMGMNMNQPQGDPK